MLLSTKCHRGQHFKLHLSSFVHASDRRGHVQNSGFIVARRKGYYYRPPQRGRCGIISFVGRRPTLFTRCCRKVSLGQLMGLIYDHLLGVPFRRCRIRAMPIGRSLQPFSVASCSLREFGPRSRRVRRVFCPCFGGQNVSLDARGTFRHRFYLTAGRNTSNTTCAYLTFPLALPGRNNAIINFRRQRHVEVSKYSDCGNGDRRDGRDRKL